MFLVAVEFPMSRLAMTDSSVSANEGGRTGKDWTPYAAKLSRSVSHWPLSPALRAQNISRQSADRVLPPNTANFHTFRLSFSSCCRVLSEIIENEFFATKRGDLLAKIISATFDNSNSFLRLLRDCAIRVSRLVIISGSFKNPTHRRDYNWINQSERKSILCPDWLIQL